MVEQNPGLVAGLPDHDPEPLKDFDAADLFGDRPAARCTGWLPWIRTAGSFAQHRGMIRGRESRHEEIHDRVGGIEGL
jgi:hypothetical protein